MRLQAFWSVTILSEGLVGHALPHIFVSPHLYPPVFFLILRSFGWHMQGFQMRFVKVPAILSTAPDRSCAIIRNRPRQNRETISIVKPQLIIIFPYFGWFVTFRCVCVTCQSQQKIASTAANKHLSWQHSPLESLWFVKFCEAKCFNWKTSMWSCSERMWCGVLSCETAALC